jgi:hypothetical protein
LAQGGCEHLRSPALRQAAETLVATLEYNKMNKLIILIAVIFIFTFCEKAIGQDNIGINFFGLSIHPKGEKDNS